MVKVLLDPVDNTREDGWASRFCSRQYTRAVGAICYDNADAVVKTMDLVTEITGYSREDLTQLDEECGHLR